MAAESDKVRFRTFRNIDIGYIFHAIIIASNGVDYEIGLEDVENLVTGLFNMKYYLENKDEVKFRRTTLPVTSAFDRKL